MPSNITYRHVYPASGYKGAMGVDMCGKTVMITGFTAGIGQAAAFALARLGANLALVCRNEAKGSQVGDAIRQTAPAGKIRVFVGDLASQRDVRRVASEFLETGSPLHVLFNNAGVIMRRREVTKDGYETTFAVNHLAYFLMTNLLLDRLRDSAPARVVCTASDAYKFSPSGLDLEDLQSERRYRAFQAYGRSKLCNILFCRELARREAKSQVTSNAFHPGFVGSDFSKNNGRFARFVMTAISPFARSNQRGAQTGVYLCSSSDVAATSGQYFFDRKPRALQACARDASVASELWAASGELTGTRA